MSFILNTEWCLNAAANKSSEQGPNPVFVCISGTAWGDEEATASMARKKSFEFSIVVQIGIDWPTVFGF